MMTKPKTMKGRMLRNLARLAIAGPWRGGIERLTRAIGHRFPTNIAVGRLCHHVGAALIEREGAEFNRVAVFESGGRMRCAGEDNVALLCMFYYFTGTITGQTKDERAIVKLFRRAIGEGDIFFDIGANVGFYSFFAAPLCGSSGAVHAFEANPILISHLLRSAELNKANANIIVNPVAVGKEINKTLQLYDPERIGASSLYQLPWLNAAATVSVPVTTIDHYRRANGIKRVDVVKIDIEGAELDALAGMLETFDICPPWLIVCELLPLAAPVSHSVEPKVSGRRRSYQVQIIEFLAAKGYEPRYISEKDGGLADPVNPRDMEGMSEDLNVAFIRRNLTSTRPDLFCAVTGDARE